MSRPELDKAYTQDFPNIKPGHGNSLAEKVKKHFEFFVRSAERAASQSAIEKVRTRTNDSAVEAVFGDMRETGDAAGINRGSQKQWIAANFGHKSSLAREYANYAGMIEKEKDVEALIEQTFKKAGIFKVCGFLAKAMETAPLFGIVTALLFEDVKNPESDLSKKLNGENRPIDRLYPEVIHEAANAFYSIETIFHELGERCKSDGQNQLLKPFLEAWKKQLQMYVLDCVNLLNGYVMHLTKEDCAVMYSSTDFQVHRDKFGQIQKNLLRLQAHKVFSRKTEKDHVNYCGLFSNLAKFDPDFNGKGRTNITVPTMCKYYARD